MLAAILAVVVLTPPSPLESAARASISTERLSGWHDRYASEPHVAGTPGDARAIADLVDVFGGMGLDVERHDFTSLLSFPQDAALEIVEDDGSHTALPLVERPVSSDADASHPELPIGFNAYAATGDVTAEVVYVNYGRREDFARLRDLGVDLTGRIALARYGGNFRGYKAKFAEAAGAVGLVIYTDPADSGYMRGLPYPEGGWANETSIQRGSIKTLPYPGDPLTPGIEATADAPRLDPDRIALPRIPVQPVGWGAARAIMERMTGRALPPEWITDWQGALPFAYRLEGGPALRVRLMVRQDRRNVETANVVATLRGRTHPDEWVILGCHHDSWGFGASDPVAGLIVLMEAARVFAAAARDGHRPARSILFAAWGAEEWGIIGSTEWCEAHRAALSTNAVAYLNLDMAATGPNFRSSAAPSLKSVISSAARDVRTIDGTRSVFDAWFGAREPARVFGNLGGGSDHIGLYCHLGVPSCSLGAGGSHGTAYHSNYDTRAWYHATVGDDYASARLVTEMATTVAARLANAALLPLDPVQYAADTRHHLDALWSDARAGAPEDAVAAHRRLGAALDRLERSARTATDHLTRAHADGRLTPDAIDAANDILRTLERAWLADGGLAGRPWFRSLYAATDPHSGYAAWMLPGLRGAIEDGPPESIAGEIDRCTEAVERLEGQLGRLARVGGDDPGG